MCQIQYSVRNVNTARTYFYISRKSGTQNVCKTEGKLTQICKLCAEYTCERISYKIYVLYNLKISERQAQIRSRLGIITLSTDGCCYLAVRCESFSCKRGHCSNE